MPKADINGIRYNYEVVGNGEPIVLICGFGGSLHFWKKATEPLSQHHMVISVDNRGSGLTECDLNFSIDDMADDISGLLDHLSIRSAHIVGWSLGSNVAQMVAIRHPEKIKTLILMSTYLYRPSRSAYLLDTALFTVEHGAPKESFGRILNGLTYTESFFEMKEKDGMPIKTMDIDDIRNLRAQLNAVDLFDTHSSAPNILAPTLCIHGTEDIMVEIIEGRRTCDTIPGCQFMELKGEGHYLPSKLYVPIIIDFIGRHR